MLLRAAFAAALLAAAPIAGPTTASASVLVTGDPGLATELEARMRWGHRGWEAGILDNFPGNNDTTLDAPGAPAWRVGFAHAFEVTWTAATGTLTLAVDFDRDGKFARAETISRDAFGKADASLAGLGFAAISISGNESKSEARSFIEDLTINGVAQDAIKPGGDFAQTFYAPADGGVFGDVLVTGKLTFANDGRSQERPSWSISFRGPGEVGTGAREGTPVPEPGTLALFGLGLLGLGLVARKRTAA